jgi:hypothetical protein
MVIILGIPIGIAAIKLILGLNNFRLNVLDLCFGTIYLMIFTNCLSIGLFKSHLKKLLLTAER